MRKLHGGGVDIHAAGEAALIGAAAAGHVAIVRYLHQNGAALSVSDDAPLVEAAGNGHLEVVRYLHRNGSDLRARHDAAFCAAAAGGHVRTMHYLHTHGVSLLSAGANALARACSQGSLKAVCYLHTHGVNLSVQNELALRSAIDRGQEQVVRYLYANGCALPDGADLDPAIRSPALDHSYWSMVFPVVTGQLARIATLHEAGLLGDGQEACLLAAANGQLAVLRFLHGAGCDIARIARRALALAAANGRLDIVEFLHQQGCDIRCDDNAALKAAVSKGHLPVVRYLQQKGADIKACRSDGERLLLGRSPQPAVAYLAANGVLPHGPRLAELIRAVRGCAIPEIEARLAGIDVPGHSALLVRIIVERDAPDVLQLFRERGLAIQLQRELAVAAEKGHLKLVRYLYENGAAIRPQGSDALNLACQHGRFHVVKFLCEHGADLGSISDETLGLVQLNGFLRVFNYLTRSGVDAIAPHRAAIAAMRDELYAAKPVYRPSALWEHFNSVNLTQLAWSGLSRFKRTINQNYFNFVPQSLFDPQFGRLARRWLAHPTRTPFRALLIDPDVSARTSALLPIDTRVFSVARRYRFLQPIDRRLGLDIGRAFQRGLYRWMVSMLWDFAIAHDRLGVAGRTYEPRVGSPIEIFLDGRLVSQDLAHSIIECNAIFGEVGELRDGRQIRIAEIGAGYGRLGYVILGAVPCQYVVFDIPPSLYVSQWYLGQVFPHKRIFRFRHFERFADIEDELASSEIAFFAANQIELLPDGYFDVGINISSLHELRLDQIGNMLGQIFRVTKRYVYLKQYKKYINPYDGICVHEDNYVVPPGWSPRFRRDDPVDPRFFETLIAARDGAARDLAERLPAAPAAPRQRAGPAREPTVSILLANYNHAQYLHTSLSGICGQTRPADEVIIVDDGSTDDSIAVVESFAARFPNIRLIKNDWNRGQHYSIQRALLAAKGDYVVWAASDDLLLPHFLERSLEWLGRHPETGLCCSLLSVFVDGATDVRTFDFRSHGIAFDYGHAAQFVSPAQFAAILRTHYVWISGNTVVARRSALLEIGGFEQSLRWHADWFAYYVLALRYGACLIPETLALMRERPGTYSGDGLSDRTQQHKVLKAIFDMIKSPKYRDLRATFRRCPSLLSLFGRAAVFVAARYFRHWDIAWSLGRWHAPIFLARMRRRLNL